jgi:hypothetical protein
VWYFFCIEIKGLLTVRFHISKTLHRELKTKEWFNMTDARKNQEELTLAEEGGSTMPPVGGDFMEDDELSLEEIDLDFSDDVLSELDNEDNDDVIELTEMVEEPASDDGVDDIVLETQEASPSAETADLVKEEEEIIELVEAVEDESPIDEAVFEPDDLAVEEPPEPDLSDLTSASGTSEEIGKAAVADELELEMPEDGPSIPGVGDESPELDLAFDQDETTEDETAVPQQAADGPGDMDALQGVSREKIEEIIAGVVKDVIDEKADKILLEVAEAAIQREIEKIKNML